MTILAGLLLHVAPVAASAATQWVALSGSVGTNTSCASPGYIGVVPAVQTAINDAEAGDIVHLCPGTWNTNQGDSVTFGVDKALILEGSGQDQTIIDGTDSYTTAIYFAPTDPAASFTVRNLTIQDTSSELMGAIGADASLTIEGATLRNNGGPYGAVTVFSGSLTIRQSTFIGKPAGDPNPNLVGLATSVGPITVEDSTFADNQSSGALYGGLTLVSDDETSDITIDSSTFTNLKASCVSAVADVNETSESDVAITNSTFTGNNATGECDHPPAHIFGSSNVELRSSTVAEKSSTGVENQNGQVGGVILGNNLKIGNSILDLGGCQSTGSSNLGGNVVSEATPGCDQFVGGPVPSLPAKVPFSSIALGSLALNAPGMTETMALGAVSVARRAAISANCPATDQRAVARPAGDCDSGAYQYQASSPSTVALTVSKSGAGNGTVTSSPAGVDCGQVCSANFAAGSMVTLTASPAAGSSFTGWSGNGCSGTGTCQVTMSEARSVTATFNAITPSNDFTVGKPRRSVNSLVARVKVPGAGVITQTGTRPSGDRRITACRTAPRTASSARTIALACRLTTATQTARRKAEVRVRLCTTFTPTGGTKNTKCRTATLPKIKGSSRPNYTG